MIRLRFPVLGLLAAFALAGCNPDVANESIAIDNSGSWSVANPTGANLMDAPAVTTTTGGTRIHVIGGNGGGGPVSNTWILDLSTGLWSAGGALVTAMTVASAAVTAADEIFLLGGADGVTTVNTVQRCTGLCRVGSAAWDDPGIGLQTATERSTAAALGTDIYVMGGCSACFGEITDVQLLDTAGPSVSTMPNPMAGGTGRYNHMGVEAGGLIYIFGGRNFSTFFSDSWAYSAGGDSWLPRANMPIPLTSAATAVIGGKIYLAGGVTTGDVTVNTLYIYDIGSDTWAQGPDMPAFLNSQAVAVANGNMYVIGGRDPTNFPVNNTYVYSP